MSGCDCAAFDATLAEALAAPGPGDPATAERLRAHAASCTVCRGSLDLVDLVAVAADARDPFPEPPPSYWARFEGDLAARIAAEKSRRARRQAMAWAAAAVVVLALSASVVLRQSPFRSETGRGTPAVDSPVLSPDDSVDPFPAAGALGFADEDDPSLFPGTDDLPPEGEERLLEWLERERERAGGGAA